jgi:hypothetical protein
VFQSDLRRKNQSDEIVVRDSSRKNLRRYFQERSLVSRLAVPGHRKLPASCIHIDIATEDVVA